MMYVVRNLLGEGVESVGTNPLEFDGAVYSAATRTGRTELEIAGLIARAEGAPVEINPACPEGFCRVRVEPAARTKIRVDEIRAGDHFGEGSRSGWKALGDAQVHEDGTVVVVVGYVPDGGHGYRHWDARGIEIEVQR
jgi:hypothetical protein